MTSRKNDKKNGVTDNKEQNNCLKLKKYIYFQYLVVSLKLNNKSL